jgi:hypothetical protein
MIYAASVKVRGFGYTSLVTKLRVHLDADGRTLRRADGLPWFDPPLPIGEYDTSVLHPYADTKLEVVFPGAN